jgi:hypothetical protein
VEELNRSSNNLGELGRKKLRGEEIVSLGKRKWPSARLPKMNTRNARNLLNVDSSLNQPALLCEQSILQLNADSFKRLLKLLF